MRRMRALIDLLIQHDFLLVFLVTLAARIGAPVPAAPLPLDGRKLHAHSDWSADGQ